LYCSNPLKGGRFLGAVLLIMVVGLLFLTACGASSADPTTLPTPAVPVGSNTVAPAVTSTVAVAPAQPATAIPPTPLATLPQDATPAPAVSVGRPTVSSAHPPTQPASGPGGQEYLYKNITSKRYGQGEEAYYIFEPVQPAPTKALPVIAFLHGYLGVDPDRDGYAAWINHLVRRGNLVIFPVYQAQDSRDGTRYTDNALAALKAAFQRLQDGSHARPDLANFLAVGYSAGGVIATNLAARAEKNGLPVPKALFAVTPGGCANCSILAIRNFTLDSQAELAAIPPTTKILILVGEQDVVVGRSAGNLIWQNTPQVPAANKNYLLFHTDNYGTPPLVADHGMATQQPPNTLNYNGIWKLSDGLESCTFEAKSCEVALGNTPKQRSLGQWSDGTPVKELTVLG
jgi:acetyl esterase/lipase